MEIDKITDNAPAVLAYQIVGKPVISFVTGLADYFGLGDWLRNDILNTDRYKGKVYELEKKLAKINASYTNKVDKIQAEIDALTTSGLPLPGKASGLIAQRRQELLDKQHKILEDQSLVSDYGELAKKTLDTSNMQAPDFHEYNRKINKYKELESDINEKLQKSNIEERL